MENSSILTYLLLTPLLGSLILLFLKKEQENLIQWFGLAVSLAAFVISIVMLINFDQAAGNFQLIQKVLEDFLYLIYLIYFFHIEDVEQKA